VGETMYQWPEQIPWEEYIRLYFLEKTLRRLVVDCLEKLTNDWWKQRIPKDVRDKAEERKNKSERAPYPGPNLHPIWYIDFPDYAKIITRKDNWQEVFKPIFGKVERVKVMMDELKPIRDKIAHMKPLTPREQINLEALSRDLLECIWEHICNKPYVSPAKKHIRQGRYEEAEKLLLEGFKKTRSDPWISYNLGKLYRKMQRLQEAKEWFTHAEKHLVLPRYKELAKKQLRQVEEEIRMGKIKVCPRCSSEVHKEDSYCGNCGYKF
jgi:tetratricopeptide (TPR) repeat protein